MSFNLASIHEAIAAAVPDRDCIVHGDRRLTWAQVTERTRRLANYLRGRGLGAHTPRSELAGWQSGQDHVALYLYNGCEYLEGMLGAYKARAVPFNVNYRYVVDELVELFADAAPRAVVYHARLGDTLAAVRARVPGIDVVICVPDDSGAPPIDGAVLYDDALAAGSPDRPDADWSPDDLYMLYTGGTTGAPKGVLWRQHDIFVAALGGRRRDGSLIASTDEMAAVAPSRRVVQLPTPPMMHGAAHWASFVAFHAGGTVVIQRDVDRLDPRDVLETAARERVTTMLIVGDAFAQPLLDELDAGDYDLSGLEMIASGGAAMSLAVKHRILARLPHITLLDAVGASESGSQMVTISTGDTGAPKRAAFVPRAGACLLDESRAHRLPKDCDDVGWLAQTGHLPLGYLNDRAKTEATFPTIDGVRYSVPGDRARWTDGGLVELLGRDAVTINSGGEKIFAEEVERALKRHPDVYDVVVCGRPSQRWGQEVCAVVKLRAGSAATADDLLAIAGEHIARYKLPKLIAFDDAIVRHPNGKVDYRWAKARVADA